MENFLLELLKDPSTISFSILFVGLLWYVLTTTGNREDRYLETIQNLTKALGELEFIKATVEKISERINKDEK